MFKAKAGSSPGVDDLRFRNLLFDLSALHVSMCTWEQVGASLRENVKSCLFFCFFFFLRQYSFKIQGVKSMYLCERQFW